jgi:hypothetical protein
MVSIHRRHRDVGPAVINRIRPRNINGQAQMPDRFNSRDSTPTRPGPNRRDCPRFQKLAFVLVCVENGWPDLGETDAPLKPPKLKGANLSAETLGLLALGSIAGDAAHCLYPLAVWVQVACTLGAGRADF